MQFNASENIVRCMFEVIIQLGVVAVAAVVRQPKFDGLIKKKTSSTHREYNDAMMITAHKYSQKPISQRY